MEEFHIAPLEDAGFERWFDIGPPPEDMMRAAAALRSELTAAGPRQPFRLLGLDSAGAARAKIGGYITNTGRLTFWAVRHRAGEDASARRALTRLLIQACCARARANASVRYIEAQPAHDTPDLAIFLEELRAAGLREVAESHLYEYEADAVAPRQPLRPNLSFALADSLADGNALERAFEAANRDTADRAALSSPLTAAETLAELRHAARDSGPPLPWWMAITDLQGGGQGIAGYILCTAAPAKAGHEATAHIVEIGVVPTARRQGVARALLEHALHELFERGVRTVTALIDDENTGSIRLHEGLGFRQQPGSYWTWHLNIRRQT